MFEIVPHAIAQQIQPASRLLGAVRSEEQNGWCFSALAGHLVELSGSGASSAITLAFNLICEAQGLGEPAAWVTTQGRCFYPPDAAEHGADLDTLAVVRVSQEQEICKAADYLLRSGAFGVVVMDLGDLQRLPEKQLTRLLGLARRHVTAIVCLTTKREGIPSLGGLVSMHGRVGLVRRGPGEYIGELYVLKDKRRTRGWRHWMVWHAPSGLS